MPRSRPPFSRSLHPSRHRGLVVVLAALACLTGACRTSPTDGGAGGTDRPVTDDVAPTEDVAGDPVEHLDPPNTEDTDSFPTPTDIEWSRCGAAECIQIAVPVDHAEPEGPTIDIAVGRVPAADPERRIGTLFVNPGGPGSSAIELAKVLGASPAGPQAELLDRFDIVGVDPRGVGNSEPDFGCGIKGSYRYQDLEAELDGVPTDPEEIEAGEAAIGLCTESMGDAAGQLGTDPHVRDLDVVRRALGEERVSFLGFSYGSVVGAWYATLFPDHVRAMVLDGADNPIDDFSDIDATVESIREEIEPLERLTREMLDACVDPTCPIYNDGDPAGYYLRTLENGERVDDAMNVPGAISAAVITPLYDQSTWPDFWAALAALEERDDPEPLVDIAAFQFLGEDPREANITGYINCLDGWALYPDFDRGRRYRQAEELEPRLDELMVDFPLTDASSADLGSACTFMDLLDPPTLGRALDGGGAPILVVANRSDPVTPYGESVEMAESFSNGFVVEVDHPAHGVFGQNDCVDRHVLDFLLDERTPDEQAVCKREAIETDARAFLLEVCTFGIAEYWTDLDRDMVDGVCRDSTDAMFDRYSEDEILAAIEAEDDGFYEEFFALADELSPAP